jgi:predicted PurR-regulated permease PerM
MQASTKNILKVLSLTTLFVGGLYLAYLTRHEIFWLITAGSLALALNPIVVWLSQYMPRKSRGAATGVVFFAIILALVLFAITLVPPLISQSEKLVQDAPNITNEILAPHTVTGDFIRRYNLANHIKTSQDQIVGRLTSASGSLVGVLHGLFSSVVSATTIIVLTFFMLSEGTAWRRRFWALVPERHRARNQRIASDMYHTVGSYVLGKIIMSLAAAIPTGILLLILHVPFAISLAIIVGLFDLIPLVGATLGAIIVVLACLFTSTAAAIVMAIFFLIFQQVENHVFQPLLFGKTVAISPLLVLVAVLFGAALGNILGALIAIPVVASIQILVKDYLPYWTNRSSS